MQVLTFAPSERLAPYVSVFRIVEAVEETTRMLVPDAGMTLGIRFSGAAHMLQNGNAVRVPDATLAGFRSTARHMRTSAGGGVVLAAFHPAGAAQFFQHPLHELFGATVPLEAFLPASDIARSGERIAEARAHGERVRVLEELLLRRLRPVEPDPLVKAAISAIRARRGAIRIAELAAQLGVRIDPLEKRFRRAVGGTPKQLASILRLKHAVESHRKGINLAQLSLEAGYCDQSHFIRELKAVTGQSPRRFFAARSDYC